MPQQLRDLTLLSRWGANENATWSQINDQHAPWFPTDPILKSVLVDGQRPSWDPSGNERSDLQVGSSVGSNLTPPVAWTTGIIGLEWAERFDVMPTPPYGSSGWRWWVAGPEIHNDGSTGQALMMMEVSELGRRRLNANAGASSPRYVDLGPITLGEWVYWRMEIIHTTGAGGRIRVYRFGQLVGELLGPTQNSQGPGYWKNANYTTALLNGRREFSQAGFRVYDGLPADRSAGTPPPDPGGGEPSATLPSPPHDGAHRVGLLGTSQWQASQPGSMRGSVIVTDGPWVAQGIVIPMKGRGSGYSGQQGHVGAIYQVIDPNDPLQDVLVAGGVTAEVVTLFDDDADYKVHPFAAPFTLPEGIWRLVSFSGPNAVAMYGVTPGAGSSGWAYQTSGYPVPVSPFGSTSGGIAGLDTSRTVDAYLWVDPVTTPSASSGRALASEGESGDAFAIVSGVLVPASEVRHREVGPPVTFHATEAFHVPTQRLVEWVPELQSFQIIP